MKKAEAIGSLAGSLVGCIGTGIAVYFTGSFWCAGIGLICYLLGARIGKSADASEKTKC